MNILTSNIASVVSNQLGNLEGKVEVQTIPRIQNLNRHLTDELNPLTLKELKSIIKKRDQFRDYITNYRKRVETFREYSNTLDPIIQGLKATITVVKSIPLPVSVPPGVGIPLSTINIISEILYMLNESLRNFENDKQSINQLLNNTDTFTNDIEQSFTDLDSNIDRAIKKLPQKERNQLQTVGSKDIKPQEELTKIVRIDNQKYLFKLQTVNNGNYEQNQVLVYTENQVLVYKGNPSFSFNTNILFKEAEFELRNLKK